MATETTTARKQRTARTARKAAATRTTKNVREATKKVASAAKSAARANAKQGAGMIQDSWDATVQAFTTAQAEVERQIQGLLQSKRISQSDAAKTLKGVSVRLEKERKKAAKELDSRVRILQARVKKERKALTGLMNDAVRGTLATLNIPSRQEVADLTRKVDELSRKIDSFRTERATA